MVVTGADITRQCRAGFESVLAVTVLWLLEAVKVSVKARDEVEEMEEREVRVEEAGEEGR